MYCFTPCISKIMPGKILQLSASTVILNICTMKLLRKHEQAFDIGYLDSN
ncbi:predicted protein [Botrytis cinerea T4]|uniref:Uncharacterized protein n=1 Tax=Botryotinia fuckeliana (strain T4) TaxID=999810 RepID=G2YRM5_BOTF4|nr:predicted protein [Botrytis cinerea T4]